MAAIATGYLTQWICPAELSQPGNPVRLTPTQGRHRLRSLFAHPYLSPPSNPSCARCRPNNQVVVDGTNAGRDLNENMDRLLLCCGFDDAPQVNGAVLHGDAEQRRPGPALV